MKIMTSVISKHLYFVFFLLLLGGLSTACSNSTSSDHDDHPAPEGFVLKLNGTNIVTQADDEIEGSIEVTESDETALISIWFLDHDGDEFQPEDEDYELEANLSPTGIAEFEQHEEDGKWGFHIHGVQSDTTYLTLDLMHGGHSDFETKAIPVHVVEAQ